MENFFLDRLRANPEEFQSARLFFSDQIASKECLIVGSAPGPVFPRAASPYVICVNGSVAAIDGRYPRPDLTYLNSAIFRDEDGYAHKTRAVLANKHIGHVLVSSDYAQGAADVLLAQNTSFSSSSSLTKYCKRLVLGEVLGHYWHGGYRHHANVSNGVFMAAFALWCGASRVSLVGFSLKAGHSYSDALISARDHVKEDILFLRRAANVGLPVATTSLELHEATGVPLTREAAA